MWLRWVAAIILLWGCCGWAQQAKEAADGISIDLGWVAAVQQHRGWLVTSAPPPPRSMPNRKRALKTGDVLLRVDGHDLAQLGPLAVARILNDVPFRSVLVELVRDGNACEVHAFGEGVWTDGTTKSAPTYWPDELQKRDETAPQFSLLDLNGKEHSLGSYSGKWVLLNFWGTWCPGCIDELPALNDLASNYKTRVTVVSVALNDSPEALRNFLAKQSVSYAILLGGTFDDRFARRYNVHIAPTNVVIAPDGEVRFVGVGQMSLKGAVQTIAHAQKSAPVR